MLEEVHGLPCEIKDLCLKEVYGWACETKGLCLKKYMVGACENKGFVLEEVCMVGKFGWGVLVKVIKASAPGTLCWLHRGTKEDEDFILTQIVEMIIE